MELIKVKIELELQEVDIVLAALAAKPYAEVHAVIAKVHGQATSQIPSPSAIEAPAVS